jgi:hypothetical protein
MVQIANKMGFLIKKNKKNTSIDDLCAKINFSEFILFANNLKNLMSRSLLGIVNFYKPILSKSKVIPVTGRGVL